MDSYNSVYINNSIFSNRIFISSSPSPILAVGRLEGSSVTNSGNCNNSLFSSSIDNAVNISFKSLAARPLLASDDYHYKIAYLHDERINPYSICHIIRLKEVQ